MIKMFRATLEFEMKDPPAAQRLLSSLEADNIGFVETELVGSRLVCRISAETVASLRHTMDDLLACADLAYSVMGGQV